MTAGFLPPTQHLIMETLAARFRTGEIAWTFPNSCAPAARELERHGRIKIKDAPVPGCFMAWLTTAGKQEWLGRHGAPIALDPNELMGCGHNRAMNEGNLGQCYTCSNIAREALEARKRQR